MSPQVSDPQGYRMSYTLRLSEPKPPTDLGEDEGLTDHLLVVSILGTPGTAEPLSIWPVLLGPAGPESLDAATAAIVASCLLAVAVEVETLSRDMQSACATALAALREPFRR